MNVKRKTVRFQDNASDLAVYEAISNYKSYGFRSESHMVVEAVKQFIHKDSSEEQADLIVQKLSGKITLSEVATDTADAPTSEAAFDAALNFLEGL